MHNRGSAGRTGPARADPARPDPNGSSIKGATQAAGPGARQPPRPLWVGDRLPTPEARSPAPRRPHAGRALFPARARASGEPGVGPLWQDDAPVFVPSEPTGGRAPSPGRRHPRPARAEPEARGILNPSTPPPTAHPSPARPAEPAPAPSPAPLTLRGPGCRTKLARDGRRGGGAGPRPPGRASRMPWSSCRGPKRVGAAGGGGTAAAAGSSFVPAAAPSVPGTRRSSESGRREARGGARGGGGGRTGGRGG
jgi:hypothetical protein